MPKPTPPTPPPPPYPAIQLDWEEWMPMVDDTSLTDAEKRQVIEALWDIVVGFVDLGWGIAPSEENGGEVLDLTSALQASMVSLEGPKESEAV